MTEVIEQIKVKEIKQGKEKRNVPRLRFREFKDEWKEKKLGSLGSFFKGNGLSKADLSYDGQECILYGELYTKYNEVITNIQSKTNLEDKNFIRSKINDVIIPSSGETAIDIATASCVKKDNVILGGDLNVFRPNDVDGIFVSYQLNNQKRTEIAKIAQGASVVHVYNEQLKKVKICITEIQEQKKIADFFSLVDKKIEKQSEKVEALKTYKKGIMQKIFKQEIRFKDENGREYPEWEEKRLGDIGKTYTGLSGKTKEDFETGNAKYITYMNVFKNIKIKSELIDIVDIKDNENQNKVLEGDLLFTTSSETAEEVGMVSLCDKYIENLYLNSFCFGFRIKNLKINSNFIVYYLRSPKIRKKISILAQGSTRYNLSKNELMKLAIEIPCIEEQTQIATFLCTIDERMDKEEKKLEELKVWKKGLLQKMFI